MHEIARLKIMISARKNTEILAAANEGTEKRKK
jgi:hypothetical protein